MIDTSRNTNAAAILDNPIWAALTTEHAPFALGGGVARRYPAEIAPFGAVAVPELDAFAALAQLLSPGDSVALLNACPPPGEAWDLLRQVSIVQMIYAGPTLEPMAGNAAVTLTRLGVTDVPAMLQLVDLTHPGPFLPRTIELGRYLGVWQEGRLAAMAGERFHLSGYQEISAVCTHPDFQRRGYARALVRHLIQEIQQSGDVPFLHVLHDNSSAIALYERMGFIRRAELVMYVLRRK